MTLDDAVTVSLLRALANDCDNTDGWEDAAPTVRQAADRIESLSRMDGVREALDRMVGAAASINIYNQSIPANSPADFAHIPIPAVRRLAAATEAAYKALSSLSGDSQ